MMRPQPRLAMAGPNSWPSRNGAVRFSASEASHSATVSTGSGGLMFTPAALTTMSGGPKISLTRSQAAGTAARSLRSAQTRPARPPAWPMAATAARSGSSWRASRTTRAPAAARARPAAAPMPELPPVTRATRPSSEKRLDR